MSDSPDLERIKAFVFHVFHHLEGAVVSGMIYLGVRLGLYTAMSGAGRWEPRLCGSSFAQFLRILAAGMEVAQGFGEAMMDDEDEAAFREAFGQKIKTIDAAALRAGHWT